MAKAETMFFGKAPKKRRKFQLKWAKLLHFLFLFALTLLILEMSWLYLANLFQKAVVARVGVIEKGAWMEVLLLREEQLVTAPVAGRMTMLIKSGTRIPRNEIIAWLDTNEKSREKNLEISAATLELYKQYQELMQDEIAQKKDLERIRNNIAWWSEHSGHNISDPDLELLKQEKERVLRTIQKILPQERQIRQKLKPVLNRWRFITSEQAGYFSLATDGWEKRLQPAAFESLTEDDFKRDYPSKKPGNYVKAGEVIGKLIHPFKQLVAVKVHPEQAGRVKKGDLWRLKTKNGWVEAPVTYLKKINGQPVIAGVEIPLTATDLTLPRQGRMFIVYQKVTGVAIPVQALYQQADLSYCVRIVKGSSYREQIVQVLASDGSKAIVTGIEAGTTVISR
ncbi:MAG TPA: HlyD family efflux transporter periplasmic adaptor subunit [Bacillota bacterium]